MPDWAHEQFLTVAEVAATLRLNQQTIRNWIDAGTLPAVRVGRRVRVLRSDLQRLVDQSSRPSAQDDDDRDAGARFWSGEHDCALRTRTSRRGEP